MNCHQAGALIAAYADGEIGGGDRRSIEGHLRECKDCAAKHQEILALRARIQEEVRYFPAPPALRERLKPLLADAHDAQRTQVPPAREQWRWLAGGAFAGCAATLLAFFLSTVFLDSRAREDIAREAVEAHVHATLDNRLVEVASSDQHTVKPWLSARLDYSPPVRDLAADGFPLSGGRIEALHGQRVATLVYRYRQHTIDVFVRPEPVPAPVALPTVRGFNVAHATGAGMDWIAVSDVSADVLNAFVQQLAGEAAKN